MKYVVFLAFLAIGGCRSTERIARFADDAAGGLSELDPPVLTFTGYCRLYTQKGFEPLTDTVVYMPGRRGVTECIVYEKADSVMKVTNQVLATYLRSLETLADKKLGAIKSKELVVSLSALHTDIDPAKTLTGTQEAAAARLLNSLINLPVNAWRTARLRGFIRRSQADFDSVAAGYAFMVGTVLPQLMDQVTENYRSFVYAPEYRMATGIDKIFVNRQYADFLDARARDRKVLVKAGKLIATIREGHHRLAIDPSLDAGDVETSVAQYTLAILEIRNDIRTLLHS